jgi:hypothetical protein
VNAPGRGATRDERLVLELSGRPPTTCAQDGEANSRDRLSSSLLEDFDARVWSGLHFRTSMVEGAELGRDVADLVSTTLFQPT